MLIGKLKKLFRIDRPELDFGVYRILHARAAEIERFLEQRLMRVAEEALGERSGSRGSGTKPLFAHLLTFFSRYYDSGDFISQRRYKGDTYAIPYAGEEVVFHWANKDQYYTKTGETFANFTFRLSDGRAVHLRLTAADTAKDNRKDNDKERRFVLIERYAEGRTDEDGNAAREDALPIEERDGELVLRFAYRSMPKGTRQEELTARAVAAILADPAVQQRWTELAQKQANRTLLGKHLAHFTTKQTADYFIHKNLGRFLRRELDDYLKNEVLQLDDLQHVTDFSLFEDRLRLLQGMRRIALEMIDLLAQLEDFQRKLWLKKKFVVEAQYVVTLDRVPDELYGEIADQGAQWAQWRELGLLEAEAEETFASGCAGDGGAAIADSEKVPAANGAAAARTAVDYLKAHPSLMVDTALFPRSFKGKLLAALGDLDAQVDGVLVHGDNFQALTLLEERYRGQAACIYIDPPYNAPKSKVKYKNRFLHSTWLTLMENRLSASLPFQTKAGTTIVAIDKYEHDHLKMLLTELYPEHDLVTVAIEHNRKGAQGDHFSYTNEYAVFAISPGLKALNKVRLPEEEWEFSNLRNWGGESERRDAANCFYPIYVREGRIIGFGEVCADVFHPAGANVRRADGSIEIYPIDPAKVERKWRYARQSVERILPLLRVETGRNGDLQVMKAQADAPFKTMWYDSRYNAGDYGTKLLGSMGFPKELFEFPKSIHTTSDCIATVAGEDSLVLDFFAGSGTTGQAVIALNRKDPSGSGRRKYVLVEQGDYFNTVLKPRIQKAVFSDEWKDGRPVKPETGVSHAFKVLRLESYEDTLNNLELRRSPEPATVVGRTDAEYLLRYRLDVESRGSLLPIEAFRRPFTRKLRVAIDSAGVSEERGIDLVETFNYLLGLRVQGMESREEDGIVAVRGTTAVGERALVLWRDCERVGDEELRRFCTSRGWADDAAGEDEEGQSANGSHGEKAAGAQTEGDPGNSPTLRRVAEAGFDVIYVNGDHRLAVSELASDARLLHAIEPIFLSRMFGEGEQVLADDIAI